eukprot:338153-Pyramimonas_sp.AAC.1
MSWLMRPSAKCWPRPLVPSSPLCCRALASSFNCLCRRASHSEPSARCCSCCCAAAAQGLGLRCCHL